ncbi:Uu.00g124690.m01.CDS01 [Anthostomella pinea]|uniref:Uu.00g124690.m01.CDS01 n=1 Tax=Anthostomella pinea TaxID=933095 RepID=A0AAI8VHM3_9PEZI|nr:Uu.00g124690.m01.CDS01 [Anthostomella pinea]
MASARPSTGDSVADRGPGLITLMWALTGIASFTVVLRITFRAQRKLFGWDDLFMVISMLCFIGWSSVLNLYSQHGGVRHFRDVGELGPDKFALVQLLNWTSQVFGIIGVAAGKFSVSALLLSIMKSTELKWQRIYMWTFTIVLAGGIAVSCSILTFAQSYNTFADAGLVILPATIFLNVQSNTIQEWQLSIVSALNILTCICSGIKTQFLSELSNREDLTWATYDLFAWVTAELFLMIVCGTIPTLHPLLTLCRSVLSDLKSAFLVSRSQAHSSDSNDVKSIELGTEGHHLAHVSARSAVQSHSEGSEELVGRHECLGEIGRTESIHIEKSFSVCRG